MRKTLTASACIPTRHNKSQHFQDICSFSKQQIFLPCGRKYSFLYGESNEMVYFLRKCPQGCGKLNKDLQLPFLAILLPKLAKKNYGNFYRIAKNGNCCHFCLVSRTVH